LKAEKGRKSKKEVIFLLSMEVVSFKYTTQISLKHGRKISNSINNAYSTCTQEKIKDKSFSLYP
jgi:hypothetical protein